MTISTLTEPHQDSHLSGVSDCAGHLVRSRCQERLATERLKRAIRTASQCGASVDSISEASGFRPADVTEIVQSHDEYDNLAVLAGIG